MRILVTGKRGQVATAIAERLGQDAGMECLTLGRPEMELGQPSGVAAKVAEKGPDLVISAAAWTAVDAAEDHPDEAFRVNAEAAGEVARGAALAGAPVIHLSTDYVFDGAKAGAWTEDDPVAPLGIYGATKLEGEYRVARANPHHIILRTAWVYSAGGKNFVRTMLALAKTHDDVAVVDDQYGCPTSATDIASAIHAVIRRIISRELTDSISWGTYHFSGTGTATWCDLAREIFHRGHRLGLPSARVRPVPTSAFPTRAKRPRNSRLDCTKFEESFGYRAPYWTESLQPVLERLSKEPPAD